MANTLNRAAFGRLDRDNFISLCLGMSVMFLNEWLDGRKYQGYILD